MPVVSIRHRTTYRYRNPVAFGEHRMMLRPRESYDQRLISANLDIGPGLASLRNVQDLFGNCVGIARFAGRSDTLTFDSHVVLDHSPSPAFSDLAGEHDAYAGVLPIDYGADDLTDLSPSITQRYPDPDGVLGAWAASFKRLKGPTSVQALLTQMTRAIHADFAYGKRLEGPPQAPLETLKLKTGSCRDLAVLMIEAVRSLGLAARFVSGYVYSGAPSSGRTSRTGGGHTHAWVRVYLPACGWVEFDPTNGIVGNTDLVRVAIAREARQALPLHGTWAGFATDFIGMDVSVEIDVESEAAVQPAAKLRVASSGG